PSAKGDDKFITTDYLQQCRKNVQTGSFNYTASAVSRNAENVLLIEDAPQLAEAYQREFNRLWDEGIPLNALY
ncbi:hypothetical protein FSH73_024315, partial [Escherichia coli]|nr:hypothetical protein [Escherichia coli]